MKVIEDMKKVIKKKKAFTLVELMGVLVIIGVLSAILIPVITNVLKEQKEKAYQGQLQNITLAAKNFVSDNMFLMPETEGDSISITLGQLKKSGYAENSIINPKTKQEISNCLQIEIKKVNNNYEYVIQENTIEVDNCNEDYSSDILISGPSKTYIANGDLSSYVLIINPSDVNQVLGYNFDDSKLSLGNNKTAKYSVVGENGIYKIIIKAGETEEDINLTFEDNAITDSVGNNVDMTNITYNKIIVDNTAPVITFTNNGSTAYTNNAKTNINVNDAKSGGNSSTYKYIFSNVTSTEPTNSFTTDKEVSHTSGNGKYYLIAKACDQLGNCDTKVSDYFNMDTAGPSIPTITLVYEDNNQTYNQSWTNRNVKQIQSSSDSGVGGIYYQYSHNNSSWNSMPNNWVINTDGSWTFYVRACDSLGNCSNSAPSYWIGRDTVAPSAPTVALVKWDWTELNNDTWYNTDVCISGKANKSDPTPSATDDSSSIGYYQISSDNSTWNNWQYDYKSKTYCISDEGTFYRYIRAVDKAGNVSSVTTKTIKIDKTKPVITYNGSCPTDATYHKCNAFKFTDNNGQDITIYRSHCVEANGIVSNVCSSNGGYDAKTRVEYYYNNGSYLQGDNKTRKEVYVNGYVINMGTSFPATSIMQYSFIACDSAGNCSSTYSYRG